MTLGKRLEKLLIYFQNNELAVTKQDFCSKLGIDYTSFSKYLNDKFKLPINESNIKNFLKYKINLEWFLTGDGNMFTETKQAEILPVKIPLLRQRVSCGKGVEWQDDNIDQYIEPLEMFPSLRKQQVYAFRSSGLSMIGLGINDGDILFFDGNKNQKVRDDIYVFGLAGEAYCKLLRFEPLENMVHIYSVQSQDLREANLVKSIDADMDGFQIFGRVLAWMHENRLMSW